LTDPLNGPDSGTSPTLPPLPSDGPDPGATSTPDHPPEPPPPIEPPVVADTGLSDPGPLVRAGCPGSTSTEAHASIVSHERLQSVELVWQQGDGASGSVAMSSVGDRWEATLGAFATEGVVTWRISATTSSGRFGQSPVATIDVQSCDPA
jgi:hypothetical protein